MSKVFATPIEFLKGVGSQKAELLKKELKIFTFKDLLYHFPFRYEDRSKYCKIKEIPSLDLSQQIQIIGRFHSFQLLGHKRGKRLVAIFEDDTDSIEVIWFKGITWIQKIISTQKVYTLFGKVSSYGGKYNFAHPEIDLMEKESSSGNNSLVPVYSSTEILKKRKIENKFFRSAMKAVLEKTKPYIEENLTPSIKTAWKLIDKPVALTTIHFPENLKQVKLAENRLKFEELFYIQLRLLLSKGHRKEKVKGEIFNQSKLLGEFYNNYLSFELTSAQKRVIKEIYADFRSGSQMNRLIQGDVGSGKTIVAFLSMLIAIDSGFQCAFMAPTEILAGQHFKGISNQASKIGIEVALLTGSTPTKRRKEISQQLMEGNLSIIVGTHALLEDKVSFKKLGLAVIDEQHRFGVAQRSKLWSKTKTTFPHVMVMTATPIPRTLAMTVYGDLDISVIDELPKGRKPIKTFHFFDSKRLVMFGWIQRILDAQQQVYIVYPLIEESSTLDYKDLVDGYDSIKRRFPDIPIGVVHGRMTAEDKNLSMQQFVDHQTKILVATTVIEVGVDVPNASLMVIENAERFGLSQLHQLRGRVGRGSEQSACVLMTGNKLSNEARFRMNTMTETTDGFKISEADLKLRGPGNLLGTQQSGALEIFSDLVKDVEILKTARITAEEVIKNDPNLSSRENQTIQKHLQSLKNSNIGWEQIS